MHYCDDCMEQENRPKSILQVIARCGFCGDKTICSDSTMVSAREINRHYQNPKIMSKITPQPCKNHHSSNPDNKCRGCFEWRNRELVTNAQNAGWVNIDALWDNETEKFILLGYDLLHRWLPVHLPSRPGPKKTGLQLLTELCDELNVRHPNLHLYVERRGKIDWRASIRGLPMTDPLHKILVSGISIEGADEACADAVRKYRAAQEAEQRKTDLLKNPEVREALTLYGVQFDEPA